MTEVPSSSNQSPQSPNQHDLEGAAQRPTKTPLYQANHASRYQRQQLIKEIQALTRSRLISYVSGRQCMIDEDDTMPFVDLLQNTPRNQRLDLLLHTSGGSTDAAEKLIGMLRRRVGTAPLRIIVPDYAKSAGTLMVLGADSVVMGDMSELGPIDPQIRLSDIWQPVQNYLDAFETHAQTLRNHPNDGAAQLMLDKLEPAALKLCEGAIERARQAAESLLKQGMFRNDGNWSRTASELLDTKRWRSHGQTISWEDANHPEVLGLSVEHLPQESEVWQHYWRLYCLQRLALGERQKLYESDYASLIMGPAGPD